MREAIGKIVPSPKSRTGIIYVPADMMVDSAFPFKPPMKVNIRIEGQKLIIEKGATA